MITVSARIDAISAKLLRITSTRTETPAEAYRTAHIALLRILRKDPGLDHFPQIMDALDREAPAHPRPQHARYAEPAHA